MTENALPIFLTPVNPVRFRPTRESKSKANLKLLSDVCEPISNIKHQNSTTPRRVKSQIILKSRKTADLDKIQKPRNIIDLDKQIQKLSIDDEDYDSSGDESEFSEPSESDSEESEEILEPILQSTVKHNIRRTKSVSRARKSISVPSRSRLSKNNDTLAQTRGKLQVGYIPQDFPCRENEFDNIYNFLEDNICHGVSGCMSIAGVPGTGKTATVTSAIDCLESQGSDVYFKKALINAMHVTEPRQIYALIYQELTMQKVSLKRAVESLENELFHGPNSKHPVLILIDEIDQLCNKKQDVLYKIFSWLKYKRSKVVLVIISNTMDLAERVFHNKVASRLGVTRLTFEPYTPQQLVQIITTRLDNHEAQSTFEPQAIELAARKVAAMSGDARRALDICRRALQLREGDKKIDVACVNAVIKEMYSAPKIVAIKECCSHYEKLFLKAVVATFKSLGFEEARLHEVLCNFAKFCQTEGIRVPNDNEVFTILVGLGAYKLLIYDSINNDMHLKLRLMCSQQDVLYAFDNT